MNELSAPDRNEKWTLKKGSVPIPTTMHEVQKRGTEVYLHNSTEHQSKGNNSQSALTVSKPKIESNTSHRGCDQPET